ncbi:MAG: GGDEF domain-containing protein, partial [Pseudomonadota bacterium]
MNHEGQIQESALLPTESSDKAERDLVALGIAFAAICMFVATGGSVLPDVVRSFSQGETAPSHLLVNAMLLNIALVIFSWRRYRQLREEIATRKAAETHARQLSTIDPLTGCLNRRAMTQLAEAMRREATPQGRAVAYMMMDIDNFKQINDMYGHSVGDAVLVDCTRRIRATLPKESCFARLGGDEFACTLTYDPAAPERIEDLVIRVYEAMSSP